MPIVGNCWAQRVLKLKSRFLLLWQWMPNILISFSDKHFCPPFYLFMAPPILRHCEASMLIFSSARSSASSSVCVSVCPCVNFMNSSLKLNAVSQHSLWSLSGVSEVTWQYLNSLTLSHTFLALSFLIHIIKLRAYFIKPAEHKILCLVSSCNCSALDWYQKGILSLSILSKIVKMSYQSVLVSIPHFRTLPFEFSEVFITPITFKCFTHLIDNTWETIQFSIKIIVMAWLSSLSLWRSSSFWFLTFVSYRSYLQHFLYLSIKYIFKYRPVKGQSKRLKLCLH